MKTLLTLLLLLSTTMLLASEAKGFELFGMGMPDKDTETQTPSIDDGKDLSQVQQAFIYSLRDTVLLEKHVQPIIAKLGGLEKAVIDMGLFDAFITPEALGAIKNWRQGREITRQYAYLAIASRVWNDMQITGREENEVPQFRDYQAYIDDVNIYGDENFLSYGKFIELVKHLNNPEIKVTQAAAYAWAGQSCDRGVQKSCVDQTVMRLRFSDIQATLTNLNQSIYTTCQSCPVRSD